MRRLALAAILILTAPALAGCLGASGSLSDDTGSQDGLPWPETTGTWTVEGDAGDGSIRRLVHLVGHAERLADGSNRTVPVLWIEVPDASRPAFGVLMLDADGTMGLRGPWWTELGHAGPVPDESYRRDYVAFRDDSVAVLNPLWIFLGPGQWGRTPTGDGTVQTTVELAGPRTVTWRPVAADDGCRTIETAIDGRAVATSRFCDGPLPRRVEVDAFELSQGDARYVHPDATYTLTPDATRSEDLPAPVDVASAPTDELGRTPPDRSDLPLTLEQVDRAVSADPRTSAWFADHPDAVALRGRLTWTRCHWTLETDCGQLLGRRHHRVHTWNLTWVAPDGDRLDASVRRPAAPRGTARVVEVRTDTGPARDEVPDRVAPLATALDRWRAFDDARFHPARVRFDLTAETPIWSVRAFREPADGTDLTGAVRSTFWVDVRTGLVHDGFVAPGPDRPP